MALSMADRSYVNLFGALRSQATKVTYSYRLEQYLNYLKLGSPNKLLLMEEKDAQEKIIDYILYLKEQGAARSTLEGVSATLKKFYSMNDVLLNWDKIHAYLGEDEKTIEDEAYTHEQIKKMLQFTQLRTKVVILLLASAGVRIGALIGIKWKHLTYLEKHDIYQIVIYPKANQRYVTFCTPECVIAINNYLDYRRKCGEVITEETPLLRMDFRPGDKNVRAVTVDALKMSLIKTTKNAGVRMSHEEVNGRQTQRTKIMLAHGFRKFYCTNLGRARLQSSKIDALMGWKKGLLHVYDRSGVEELLEEYLKAVDVLTINDENRLKAKVAILEEVKDRTILGLENQIKTLREDRGQEILELQEQIAKMQSDFNSYDQKVKDAVDRFKNYDEWQKGQIRFFKREFENYREIFGNRPLTTKERKKTEEFLEILKNMPDDSDYEE